LDALFADQSGDIQIVNLGSGGGSKAGEGKKGGTHDGQSPQMTK
jgi:hypothetical protein